VTVTAGKKRIKENAKF